MLAFLGALPVVGQIITAITGAFFNAKVSLVQARIGGDHDVAVALVKASETKAHEDDARLGIFASNKLLTALLVAFATPLVIFEWKVVLVDKVLNLGSTDPITGQVGDWATTIIAFLFGAPTVMGLGKMWFGRDKAGQ